MGRPRRITKSGVAYDLLNRRVMRLRIFEKAEDYAAFEQALGEARERERTRSTLVFAGLPGEEAGQTGEAAG